MEDQKALIQNWIDGCLKLKCEIWNMLMAFQTELGNGINGLNMFANTLNEVQAKNEQIQVNSDSALRVIK